MGPESASAYSTRTWLLWFAVAALPALLTRNPYYLLLIIAAAKATDMAAEFYARLFDPQGAAGDPRRKGWRLFVRIGIGLALVGALFNAFFVHIGAHVLFRLPADWPQVGGPITVEALVYGALSGFSLVALLLVAATFSAASDTYSLLRSTPPFLYQTGVITSIGLAYVPQTLLRAQEIREAQTLRGHHFRGARDMLPLAAPLLAGGLERALQLAEAMESRGYSRDERPQARNTLLIRALLAVGPLALLLGGAWALFYRSNAVWGWLAMLVGAVLLVAAFYLLGQRSQRSRYRRQVWRPRDTTVCAALLVSLLVILAAWLLNPVSLAYTPYPALSWPDLDPVIALALLLLAAPAVPILIGK